MYSYGSPHMAAQKQDDQLERTFSSYVRIQAVVLKTYLGRWTIGRSGERGSGISVLPARYDDDIYKSSFYNNIRVRIIKPRNLNQSISKFINKRKDVRLSDSICKEQRRKLTHQHWRLFQPECHILYEQHEARMLKDWLR